MRTSATKTIAYWLAVVMALAQLARRRPGWDQYLRGIALRISDEEMFDDFIKFDQEPLNTVNFISRPPGSPGASG